MSVTLRHHHVSCHNRANARSTEADVKDRQNVSHESQDRDDVRKCICAI